MPSTTPADEAATFLDRTAPAGRARRADLVVERSLAVPHPTSAEQKADRIPEVTWTTEATWTAEAGWTADASWITGAERTFAGNDRPMGDPPNTSDSPARPPAHESSTPALARSSPAQVPAGKSLTLRPQGKSSARALASEPHSRAPAGESTSRPLTGDSGPSLAWADVGLSLTRTPMADASDGDRRSPPTHDEARCDSQATCDRRGTCTSRVMCPSPEPR
ncbi:hypothetical protein ABGB18_05290 [Nonomuraea sp. B12E4]|uniref:hypothetical protein n=1 Tax=Nonomuraea sp. B12E4 TaxID=3153564 RepID=UPI00325F0386